MKKLYKYTLKVIQNPLQLYSTYQFYFNPPSLLHRKRHKRKYRFTHVAAFTPHNSGDALQTILVRDIFNSNDILTKWTLKHVHEYLGERGVINLNKSRAIVIGSGGLVLPKFEDVSGWQWNCTLERLKSIKKPIIGFALGYNLFRGHNIDSDIFINHINTTIEKSVFWGMRNKGSVRSIKEILKPELRQKVVYQPCITTIISYLYPTLLNGITTRNVIALNCAFDREVMRYGDKKEDILKDIAGAMKDLSDDYEIEYFANAKSDEKMLQYLEEQGVKYKLIKLYDIPAKRIIEHYSYPKLVLGMRGHAQLIPFGCNTPILSLISHDKLRWFLEDIDANDWGIEVKDDGLREGIQLKALQIIASEETSSKIQREKEKLYKITVENLNAIRDHLE